MYENASTNSKQIISNYFIQDDNCSLFSLINNLKGSTNSARNVPQDIVMESMSNISKEKSISSKISTVTNSNMNEMMKKRKRSDYKQKSGKKGIHHINQKSPQNMGIQSSTKT